MNNRDPFELRDLALRAGRELEDAPATRIVEWAVAEFGERFCVTSSFADAVLAHLVSQVAPGIDVHRDVLAHLDWEPIVNQPRIMPAEAFAPL